MKSVTDIATVAHHWANQIGEDAQASHLFFQGADIYSYGRHFLIARHVTNQAGHRAVLMTTRTYSRTTSAHTTLVKRASAHLTILYVPDPTLVSGEIFNEWYSEIKSLAGQLDRVRKPQKYLLEIQLVFEKVRRYADFFGYEIPEVLVQASKIENIDGYRAIVEKEKELRKVQAARELAERLRTDKINLKQWRAFKSSYLRTADGFDHLRFNKVTQQIETSQRVKIPVETGQQFYGFVLSVIAKGGCVDCSHRLMDLYDVLEINDKFIRVGCHKISIKEIKSQAKKLGWQ